MNAKFLLGLPCASFVFALLVVVIPDTSESSDAYNDFMVCQSRQQCQKVGDSSNGVAPKALDSNTVTEAYNHAHSSTS